MSIEKILEFQDARIRENTDKISRLSVSVEIINHTVSSNKENVDALTQKIDGVKSKIDSVENILNSRKFFTIVKYWHVFSGAGTFFLFWAVAQLVKIDHTDLSHPLVKLLHAHMPFGL